MTGESATRRIPLTALIRSRHRSDRLDAVLTSFDGAFDQIIVVDEVGDPVTAVVARSRGADCIPIRVSDAESLWNDALARIASPWALWLDTGDLFPSAEVDRLRDWLRDAPLTDACLCHVRSVDDSWGRGSH